MARPIVADPSIWMASSYLAGRRRALLGGDFFDVVETPDGGLHALVGDVCGHGPDEAALGASLRIAWRALTLSGVDPDVILRTLQLVIEHERQIPGTFATICTLDVEPGRAAMSMRRAGHPLPVLVDGTSVTSLPSAGGGPPVGLTAQRDWPAVRIALPAGWSMLLYTDGLIEGRVAGQADRLGESGLHEIIAAYVGAHADWRGAPEGLLRELLAITTELNGGALTDDVAMLLVGSHDAPAPHDGLG
jgi:serine phosphatase RsbU (regulator of sigma subunit)